MKTQIPNINRVRSAWRRVKEDIKDAIIRDLKPVKDVKGGGVTGESKPTTGGGAAATNKVILRQFAVGAHASIPIFLSNAGNRGLARFCHESNYSGRARNAPTQTLF